MNKVGCAGCGMAIHYRGKLHVTTWPLGHVIRLDADDQWTDYDDGTAWASIRRFLDPAGHTFKDSRGWARVTSLTIYAGKRHGSIAGITPKWRANRLGFAELSQLATICRSEPSIPARRGGPLTVRTVTQKPAFMNHARNP